MSYQDHIHMIALADSEQVQARDKVYGSSWKKRGGVGAYMMLARKIDRIELAAQKSGWDIFKAVIADNKQEGLIDDIRDLRRYLILVESELLEQGVIRSEILNEPTKS